jgi:hypothetical protein
LTLKKRKLKITDTAIGKTIEDLGEIRGAMTSRQKNVLVQGHGEKRTAKKGVVTVLTGSVVSAGCQLRYKCLYFIYK